MVYVCAPDTQHTHLTQIIILTPNCYTILITIPKSACIILAGDFNYSARHRDAFAAVSAQWSSTRTSNEEASFIASVADPFGLYELEQDDFMKRVLDSQREWVERVTYYTLMNSPDYQLAYEHYYPGKLAL